MTSFKETCRFCLQTILNKNFEVIDDSTKEILNVLSLQLKFDEEGVYIMCTACSTKLKAAFEFKSMCLKTVDTILSYIDHETALLLDVKEIYKENTDDLFMRAPGDQKICRLCLQIVNDEFICVQELEAKAIQEFVPELKIRAVRNPVMCLTCFKSLFTHNNFLKECTEAEGRTENIFNNPAAESQLSTPLPDLFIKTESNEVKTEGIENNDTWNTTESNIDMHFDLKEEAFDSPQNTEDDKNNFIQTEVESKSEQNSEMRAQTLTQSQIETNCDLKPEQLSETSPKLPISAPKKQFKEKIYECNICGFKTKYRSGRIRHQLKHKDPSKLVTYKCTSCDFKTIHKSNLRHHQQKHKDPSQVQMYKCEQCDFKTKYKQCLKTHNLLHKDPSELHMYKCDLCNFETKHKSNLTDHQIEHEDPSTVQMYKCDTCNYESKYKHRLAVHKIKHKSDAEVPMYKCTQCDFITKYKTSFKHHQLLHKDGSDLVMYKCDECSYKSKRKDHLTSHQRTHKVVSEVPMYKCDKSCHRSTMGDECEYQTPSRVRLKRHQTKIHTDIPEVYKCEKCKYESNNKSVMRKHHLKHMDPSQVQMYKCDRCQFETKYKKSLLKHQLKHEDPSKVQMYTCDECEFQTLSKIWLKHHQTKTHKYVPTAQMYKCDKCKYESIDGCNFQRHLLKHEAEGST